MSRLALCVGIDDYRGMPLSGCVPDARRMSMLLARHHDEAANFEVDTLTCEEGRVTRPALRSALVDTFHREGVDVALFYFSGHGVLVETGGYLVTQDWEDGDWGIAMTEVVAAANRSPARERVIVLDCCHAGAAEGLLGATGRIPLEDGVTILAGSRASETAVTSGGAGLFTAQLADALDGGAADVRGFVSLPGAYSYVSDTMSGRDQRPLFRGSISRVSPIRRAEPALPDKLLRKLPVLFPTPSHVIPLDPSYEPTEEPRHAENEAVLSILQQCRAARLVVPVDHAHLYFAAMESGGCRLTPLGRLYRRMAEEGRL